MNHLLPLPTEMGQLQPFIAPQKMGKPYFWQEENISNSQAARLGLDTELFIRNTFKQDADAGIKLLFRHYYSILCSHAVRYVSSKAIAEDIVSDIFYEFHREHRYQTIATSYQTYFFTAVRNRTFDYVRAEVLQNTPLDRAESIPDHSKQSPDSITQYEELYHDVDKAITTMPLKRRQIYVLHRFEGKKCQEIADELNLSIRVIEANLYQAIFQIRNALKNKWLFLAFLTMQL